MEEESLIIPPTRVKEEPPVEFVSVLPRSTFDWPAIKQEKDVKPKLIPSVELTKSDAKWRTNPKLFQSSVACPHCQLVMKSPSNLTQHLETCKHMLNHSSEGRFCCTECGVGFKTMNNLMRHSKPRKVYKCALCNVKFLCYVLLGRHRRDFHGNIFKCGKCSYETRNKQNFVLHKGTHDKSFACSICQKKFSTDRSLKLHQMQHRQGIYATAPEKTFECLKCGKSCSTPQYLKVHERSVHDDKKVKCKVCEKICKNRHYFLMHSQIHKKVECSICHRMVIKYRMAPHLRSHSTANLFKCDLCDHSAKAKGSLKMHIEAKHLLKKLVNDFKHREDFNDFELLEKLQLDYGSSATTSEKKFECDKCGKSFVTPRALYQHKRNVHQNKLFECAICRKGFKTKSNLKCHKARVHS